MSVIDGALGKQVSPDTDKHGLPHLREVQSAVQSVITMLRASEQVLISMLNRIILSPRIYQISKLETFQLRSGIVSQYGAMGQVMRFVAYVVFASDENEYLLRIDDSFTGLVSYVSLQVKDRFVSGDVIGNVQKQLVSAFAGLLIGMPSDWSAIWNGYQDRAIAFDPQNELHQDTFSQIAEFQTLIDACDDKNFLKRVDLHLTYYTYDRLRFTILNGEVGNDLFVRDAAIYIPENRLLDFGSGVGESLLETFVQSGEIAEFVDECLAGTRVAQYEKGLLDELGRVTNAIQALDLSSEEWVGKKLDLKQQIALQDGVADSEAISLGKVADEDEWSLRTESDEDGDSGDLVWS